MRTVTYTMTIVAQVDDSELNDKDVTAILSARATAFLYPAGLTLESADCVVQAPQQEPMRPGYAPDGSFWVRDIG